MNALDAVSKGMWAVCEIMTSQLIARVIVVKLNVFLINEILQLILTSLFDVTTESRAVAIKLSGSCVIQTLKNFHLLQHLLFDDIII